MGKSNIIEINGRRYDARTGDPLDNHTILRPVKPVNDIVRPTRTEAAPAKPVVVRDAPQSKATTAVKPAPKARVHDAVKAHSQARRVQRSTTLMRSGVSKPSDSLKRHTKAQQHIDALLDKPAHRLQRKPSVHRIDDKRLQRAQSVSKSQAVSRFSRPLGPAPNPPVHLPARTAEPAEFPLSHLEPRTSPTTYEAVTDLVERALQQATSHLEPAPATAKRRLFWRTASY